MISHLGKNFSIEVSQGLFVVHSHVFVIQLVKAY